MTINRPATVLQLFLHEPDAPIKQENDDILRREPAEVVDMALGRLQKAGIVLLEWHSLLYHRMNVPVLIKDYSYVVPDEQLDQASVLLSSMGLPLSPPSTLLLLTEGDFQAKRRFHRTTLWTVRTPPGTLSAIIFHPRQL
ncbi:hypothetical protein F5887DRAFT_167063 [Amanita rubescens]|nr:hypothetical protein F5887DRAFT_167063 [Amanita rubescens]